MIESGIESIMISRRKIISRSLDNLDAIGAHTEEEEDVWYDKEKLFRDHLNEVLAKWEQIDDEIWAKIIIFEKNRRVAKAYARSSVISINGSKHGFDGVRIGLNGFDNPMRDSETKVIKKSIGDGFKIKMDDIGNIYVKRYGKSAVYAHNTSNSNEETVLGADILQIPNMTLAPGTSAKLFDMRKFTTNINREYARAYPESKRLERQCLSAISLVKTNNNLINCPLWILVINVVAMDMLKNRLQTLSKVDGGGGVRLSHTQTNTTSGSEDPYSTIESQVGLIYPTTAASDESNNSNSYSSSKGKRHSSYNMGSYMDENLYKSNVDYDIYNQSVPIMTQKSTKMTQQRKKQDDPYYCGLLARIPNFIKTSNKAMPPKPTKKEAKLARKISASQQQLLHLQQQQHQQLVGQPIPIATFHQQFLPAQNYYPYKLYAHQHHHRLSQSQLSLWDARSLISTQGFLNNNLKTAEVAHSYESPAWEILLIDTDAAMTISPKCYIWPYGAYRDSCANPKT
uniref:MH2 domain-containing protein n=1 Tax=Glossina brevipalpis TaxID=37001 RepID=A0A1A9W6Y2_9MUSC